jgi:hypothetical protein
MYFLSQSQWPTSRSHELSTPARTLRLWVRILLESCICMCFYSVCVVPFLGRGLSLNWSPVRVVLPNVYKVKKTSYPFKKPWEPLRLWDIEDPIFARQSAVRWRLSCKSYAPAAIYPQRDLLVFNSARGWVNPRVIMRLEGLSKLKKV